MPLSAPAAREHLHTRHVTYRGFYRDDGLWDIEAEITDTKTYALDHAERPLAPGEAIHAMAIRLTVNDAMVIVAIESSMDATPFGECQQGKDPMQQMVGVTLGPGWRHAIERVLGGVRGCTHLRELLFNMATAAYQTIPSGRERLRRAEARPAPERDRPPYHLGKCLAWDFNGPVVARHYPQFAGWQPLNRADKTGML